MKVQAIIPTAGVGKRLQSDVAKPLVLLSGKPMFIHTLEAFEKSGCVESIILVVNENAANDIEKSIKQYHLSKVTKIVIGGMTRSDSVNNGLNVIDMDTDIIIVHDGARPLVDASLIERAVSFCENNEAIVTAVPVKPTIKTVSQDDMVVQKTLDRNELWEIQTPQVFKADILKKAHAARNGTVATDDAALVERMGVKVKVLEGKYTNIKVTTQEDMVIAEAFLSRMEAGRI